MNMREKLVFVGNGMAAARTLEHLLAIAPDRYAITVFGEEPHAAYNRILLSPVLAGELGHRAAGQAELAVHPGGRARPDLRVEPAQVGRRWPGGGRRGERSVEG